MVFETGLTAMDVVGEIAAEKTTIRKTSTVLEAFALWFACYSIFNFQYPKRWKRTLIFTQKYLVNIQDSSKTPMDEINAITKLKSQQSQTEQLEL